MIRQQILNLGRRDFHLQTFKRLIYSKINPGLSIDHNSNMIMLNITFSSLALRPLTPQSTTLIERQTLNVVLIVIAT
jgi:hypothetical protein